MEKVELPADLGAARIETLDTRKHGRREARLRRLDRRNVDPHAPHAERIRLREQRIRGVLVHVHDAAAAADPDLAHGVEHAGIVAAIRARLHEHETLDPEQFGEHEIVGERRQRRGITQLLRRSGSIRIAVRRTEYVEMRVAGKRGRAESGRWLVRMAQRIFLLLRGCRGYWTVTLARTITSRQTPISRSRCRFISSGVEVTATAACCRKASRSRGFSQARTISRCSRSTIGDGVPAGAATPHQYDMS